VRNQPCPAHIPPAPDRVDRRAPRWSRRFVFFLLVGLALGRGHRLHIRRPTNRGIDRQNGFGRASAGLLGCSVSPGECRWSCFERGGESQRRSWIL